jgi:tRNA pseudouridine13 synthase
LSVAFAPEDFRVDELPLYEPAGEGDHTFVRVEKRLRTTEEVARALAHAAGVRPRDVGYAGRKDRMAVTTQWFSVPGLDPSSALDLALPGARVLEAARHRHKLRTGQLRGNRFRVVLSDVDPARVRERVDVMTREGMPNRFGAQRFGRDGDNAERGSRLLRGMDAVRERRKARFLVSALQSAVFNAVLAERQRPLGRLELGDVAILHGSGGLFRVDDPEAEQARADAFEISATGPVFGTRRIEPSGAVAERERAILARWDIDLETLRPPGGIRLRGSRRAFRVRPESVELESTTSGVAISFSLPAGSYATVLLEEIRSANRPPDADDTRLRAAVS